MGSKIQAIAREGANQMKTKEELVKIIEDTLEAYDRELYLIKPTSLGELTKIEWYYGAKHACKHLIKRLNDLEKEQK